MAVSGPTRRRSSTLTSSVSPGLSRKSPAYSRSTASAALDHFARHVDHAGVGRVQRGDGPGVASVERLGERLGRAANRLLVGRGFFPRRRLGPVYLLRLVVARPQPGRQADRRETDHQPKCLHRRHLPDDRRECPAGVCTARRRRNRLHSRPPAALVSGRGPRWTALQDSCQSRRREGLRVTGRCVHEEAESQSGGHEEALACALRRTDRSASGRGRFFGQ